MTFLEDTTRFLFFTGKGGVGKTSLACATAVQLADSSKRVLLVSTDPASNIGQVFGQPIGNTITALTSVPGVDALEIDPEQAAEEYRERIVGPVRGLLPDREIAAITEQLSGSCTTEIASFNEFTSLLADPALVVGYDHVIFDTAPTGHTIRLLKLPGDWTGFLNKGEGDASCLGPLSGLEKQRDLYARAVQVLTDPSVTRLVLVARAQSSSLDEVARTSDELRQAGIQATHLVVNGVLPEGATIGDPLAAAIYARESDAMASPRAALDGLQRDVVTLKPDNMVGVENLRTLLNEAPASASDTTRTPMPVPTASLRALVDQIWADGHGLVMCMGKGGVGKTTIAAAIASELAARGGDVHLTTTDPAAHLSGAIGDRGGQKNLEVSRIDPQQAVLAYREHVMATKGKDLDEAGRALLAEDLLSPCTEEVAVFQQFSHLVNQARRRFVIMDTAPTGHTLLLMDAAGAYHREIARNMQDGLNFVTPLMRLQDPGHTKVVLVTLPETTPVMEATVLQQDLERAGIRPWAWVVNQSLSAAGVSSPLLRQRAALEQAPLAAVQQQTSRIAVVPLMAREPVGLSALAQLAS